MIGHPDVMGSSRRGGRLLAVLFLVEYDLVGIVDNEVSHGTLWMWKVNCENVLLADWYVLLRV